MVSASLYSVVVLSGVGNTLEVTSGLVTAGVETLGGVTSSEGIGALEVAAGPDGFKGVKLSEPVPQVPSARQTSPFRQHPEPHVTSSGPQEILHRLGGIQSTPVGQHPSILGHGESPSMPQILSLSLPLLQETFVVSSEHVVPKGQQ